MVEITPFHDHLALEVKGWHKLWALKSRLEIPLEHIKGVQADPHPAMGWFQGLKIAGTDIPHVFRAGLFYQEGNRVFWDVRHAANTIVLDLEDESCAKLIVEVEDPAATVQLIQDALKNYHAAKAVAVAELDRALEEPLPSTITSSTPTALETTPEVAVQKVNASPSE